MSPLLTTFIIAIGLNLFIFIFAFKKQSDHFTDITYSLTFIILAVFSYLSYGASSELPKILLVVMVSLWAIRLGSYLFIRINKIGVDHRFDEMRPNWKRYIRFWVLQGTSVWLVSLPVIISLTSSMQIESLMTLQWVGFVIWLVGFLMETIADYQKYRFRNDKSNDGQFMQSGLFSVIQFPNYLGEMMVWIGVFAYAVPYLIGWDWVSILSPIWICTLLLFISGIPYLRRQSKKRYGHLQSFNSYTKNTPKLIPFIY